MPWIKINKPLKEGQFIRLTFEITKSSFSTQNSVINAAYSLTYGDLHDYQRDDTIIKANTVGKIVSKFNTVDGSYWIKFENVTRLLNTENQPAYFYNGAGPKVKMQKKELLEKAEVWV